MNGTVFFCAHCNRNQEVFEYFDDTHFFSRCQVCGYPVETGAAGKGGGAGPRGKLLLIDDDKLLLRFFSDFATEHDFQPLVAADGVSGILLAKEEQPDLILLDVVMPHMDGYEVCGLMRADPDLKDTPIIIITATTDPDLANKSFNAGATLAMEKTIDSERLLDAIEMALALQRKPSPVS
jgi:DNA-binding response OmpR family regulator